MFKPLLVLAALIGLSMLVAFALSAFRTDAAVRPIYYLCPKCSAHCRAESGDWYFKCPDSCGRFVVMGRKLAE